MNFKLNDMACGFLQKHHQLVGSTPINIQARHVKVRGKYIYFLSLLCCNFRSDQGRSWQKTIKYIYIFSNHHIFFIYPRNVIAKRWGLRKENMLDILTYKTKSCGLLYHLMDYFV
jgi:hypothetical protein